MLAGRREFRGERRGEGWLGGIKGKEEEIIYGWLARGSTKEYRRVDGLLKGVLGKIKGYGDYGWLTGGSPGKCR